MKNSKLKLQELEILSGISIVFVVLLHSNAYYITHILNISSYIYGGFTENILSNLIFSAVPIFIFISGYKYALNNINDNYTVFFRKKLKKVFKPFLIISIIFFISHVISLPTYYSSPKPIIIDLINIFRGYNFVYQLWYIPMYLLINLTYPIINYLCENIKKRILLIFTLIFLQKFLSQRILFLSYHPFDFVYYYLFFEIGVIFKMYNIKKIILKYSNKIFIIYFLCILVFSLFPSKIFINYIRPYFFCIISVITYYILSLKLKNNILLNHLGTYSFYIFLFHEPIFCSKISLIFEKLNIYNSIIPVFIVSIISILFSIILYLFIRKINLYKYIF